MQPTILVVDDEPDFLSLLRQQLVEAGFQVEIAEDDLAALSQQAEGMRTEVETLQAQGGRFETFLDGLRALMDSLFQAQGEQ